MVFCVYMQGMSKFPYPAKCCTCRWQKLFFGSEWKLCEQWNNLYHFYDINICWTGILISKWQNVWTTKPRSCVHKWKDTNSDEISTLFGMLILQVCIQKPENRMYFMKLGRIDTLFFNSVMSEEWYQLLPKFLHLMKSKSFSKNSKARRLFRIQPVFEYLGQISKHLLTNEKYYCEAVLRWKGRLRWSVYILMKVKFFSDQDIQASKK